MVSLVAMQLENFIVFPRNHGQNCFKLKASLQEDVMPKTIYHLAKFVCWGYINRAKHPNLKTLAEVRMYLYKQKNTSCEKIPPTIGSFYNHILRTFHQIRQWATSGGAVIDVRDPLEYGWEENNGNYIPAKTTNAFAPSFLVELISCNCMKCYKKSCSCQSNGEIAPTCVDAASYVKIQALHYPEQRGSPTSRGTLLIFNSHAEKIAALKKFTDLKM